MIAELARFARRTNSDAAESLPPSTSTAARRAFPIRLGDGSCARVSATTSFSHRSTTSGRVPGKVAAAPVARSWSPPMLPRRSRPMAARRTSDRRRRHGPDPSSAGPASSRCAKRLARRRSRGPFPAASVRARRRRRSCAVRSETGRWLRSAAPSRSARTSPHPGARRSRRPDRRAARRGDCPAARMTRAGGRRPVQGTPRRRSGAEGRARRHASGASRPSRGGAMKMPVCPFRRPRRRTSVAASDASRSSSAPRSRRSSA